MSVAIQPAAVSALTATETVEENAAGEKLLDVPICCGAPPTKKVYVAIPEVEVAVKVMASPSQNVEDDADDAKAVEVKLITGLSTI